MGVNDNIPSWDETTPDTADIPTWDETIPEVESKKKDSSDGLPAGSPLKFTSPSPAGIIKNDDGSFIRESKLEKSVIPNASLGKPELTPLKEPNPDLGRSYSRQYENTQKGLADLDKEISSVGQWSSADKFDRAATKQLGDIKNELIKKRAALKLETEKAQKDVADVVDKISKDARADLSKFTKKDVQGFDVPSEAAISEYAAQKAAEAGLPDDGYFKTLIYNNVKSAIGHAIIEPEVDKVFEQNFKDQYGESFDSYKEKTQAEQVKKQEQIKASALTEQQNIAKAITDQASAEVAPVRKEYESFASQANTDYQSAAQELKTQQDRIKASFDAGGLTPEQANEQVYEINANIQALNKSYTENFKAQEKAFLDKMYLINSKYNKQYQRQANEVVSVATKKLNSVDVKGISSAEQEKIKKIYQDSYASVFGRQAEARQEIDKAGPAAVPVVNAFLSTTGDAVSSIATAMGWSEGAVMGDKMQSYFRTGSTELESASDLLDPLKLGKASGALVGGMLPSVAAAIAVTTATGGAGAGVGAQMVIGGIASWWAETTQMAGGMYRDKFAETGSNEKASKAATETIASQMVLMPTYAIGMIPFVKGGLSVVKNKALRVATGAGVEYVNEMAQELPQNLFEMNIREDRKYSDMKGLTKNFTDYSAITEQFEKTALNLAPIAILGAGGQAMEKSKLTPEQEAKTWVKSQYFKDKFASMSEGNQGQSITHIYIDKGKAFTEALVDLMHANGNINADQHASLQENIKKAEQVVSTVDELGLTMDDAKVFGALSDKVDDLKERAAKTDNPWIKQTLEEKAAKIEQQTKLVLNRQQADYATVSYADGTEMIWSHDELENALNDPEFVASFANSDIGIHIFGQKPEQTQSLVDKIKEKSDQYKKEIAPEPAKAPEKKPEPEAKVEGVVSAEFEGKGTVSVKKIHPLEKSKESIDAVKLPDAKLASVPLGTQVDFKGEKGVIGRSETGEIVFTSPEGKETIIAGGGDQQTLLEHGISVDEGYYSDKHGDFYVKNSSEGPKVFAINDKGEMRPVYTNPKANKSRRDAIIKKALGKTPEAAVIPETTIVEQAPKAQEKQAPESPKQEVKSDAVNLEDVIENKLHDASLIENDIERKKALDEIFKSDEYKKYISDIEFDLKNNKTQVVDGKGTWRKEFNETQDAMRKKDILRAVAEVSHNKEELNDILIAANGLPEGLRPEVYTEVKHKLNAISKENKSSPKSTKPEQAQEIGSKEYKANTKNHILGRERTMTIADGTKITGRYKVVPAGEVLASHNENTFSKTEGYPVDKNGKTINDRDYESDKNAQAEVARIAGELNDKAISQTPVVTKDGIVIDGNNRTMSRKLAAKQNTDAEYLDALKRDADLYGIDSGKIDGIKDPMLVFETDTNLPYTTETLAKFNKAEKKEKSPEEKAVELSKTMTDRSRSILTGIYAGAERPSDVTSDKNKMKVVKEMLLSEGILRPNEMPRYIDSESGVATKEGVAFLDTLLIGGALDESVIRTLNQEGMGDVRNKIISAIVPLTSNAALKENSLQKNIHNGVKLVAKAKQSGGSVTDAFVQMSLFEQTEYSPADVAMGILLEGKGFSNYLKDYNSRAGNLSLLDGLETKGSLIDEFLSAKIKNYEEVKSNLRRDESGAAQEVQKGDGVDKQQRKPVEEKPAEPIAKKDRKRQSPGEKNSDPEVAAESLTTDIEDKAEAAISSKDPEKVQQELDNVDQVINEAYGQKQIIPDDNPEREIPQYEKDIRGWAEMVKKTFGIEGMDDVQKMGVGQNELIDLIADAVIKLIKTGMQVRDAVNNVIHAAKSNGFMDGMDEDIITDAVNTKLADSGKEKPSDGDQVEKTVHTKRFYAMQTDKERTDIIESFGLLRDIESHIQAQEIADSIISKMGINNAAQAAAAGRIEGAPGAFIIGKMIDHLEDTMLRSTSQAQIGALVIEQSWYVNELSRLALKKGQFNSALATIYQQSQNLYKLSIQKQKYEKLTEGPVPADILAKMEALDKSYKENNKKIKELEQALKLSEEQRAADNIKADIELQKALAKQAKSQVEKKPRGKDRIAKGLDDLMSAIGTKKNIISEDRRPSVVSALSEIGIGLIEEGAATLQNVAAKIQEYLTGKGVKDIVVADFEQDLQIEIAEAQRQEKTTGPIKIYHSQIRELVESGIEDIDGIVKALQEQYPDSTEREIRDEVTGYGRTLEPDPDPIEKKIREIRDIGRWLSAMEDIDNKVRPKKSGLQRDKPSPEKRKRDKAFREKLKTLPIDLATEENNLKTNLDRLKTLTANRIEDLQLEIDTHQKAKRDGKPTISDDELDLLHEQLSDVMERHNAAFEQENILEATQREIDRTNARADELDRRIKENELEKAPSGSMVRQTDELKAAKKRVSESLVALNQIKEDAGILEQKRLEKAKKLIDKQLKELERKIKYKVVAKKLQRDKKEHPQNEALRKDILKAKAERLRLQEEYDVIYHTAELKARSKTKKVMDAFWEAWGIPRVLRATGEFSFVGIQGGLFTINFLVRLPIRIIMGLLKNGSRFIKDPGVVLLATRNMLKSFASASYSENSLRELREQEFYLRLHDSKLSITKPSAEQIAHEENFVSGWMNHVWNFVGLPAKVLGKSKYERWKKLNLFNAIERANSGYMNTVRVEQFLIGEKMLEAQGKNFKDNKEDWKNMADVINTFTGRSSLGKLEAQAKLLSHIMFSPRNTWSVIKQTTPIGLFWLGKMTSKDNATGKRQVSVAQKMAMQNYMTYITTVTAMMGMMALMKDENDEPLFTIELDPRSSDWMQAKIGNTRIDLFGGRRQNVIFQSRMIASALGYKGIKRTNGQMVEMRSAEWNTPAALTWSMLKNKLAPSTGFIYKLGSAVTGKQGQYVDEYGNNITDMAETNFYPIYAETIKELYKEQPAMVATFISAISFTGMINPNTYEPKKPKPKAASGGMMKRTTPEERQEARESVREQRELSRERRQERRNKDD